MRKTAHPKNSKCDMDLEMGDAKEYSMLRRLRFSKSFQSDNHVYCGLNNNTSDFLSSFTEIVFEL